METQSLEEKRIEKELMLKGIQDAYKPEPALKDTVPGFCPECSSLGVFQMRRLCFNCGYCIEHCQCNLGKGVKDLLRDQNQV